ncbi:MAG: hypothetical protein ACK58P_15860, partial [Betaproteobacteria bacterium]
QVLASIEENGQNAGSTAILRVIEPGVCCPLHGKGLAMLSNDNHLQIGICFVSIPFTVTCARPRRQAD